MMRPLWQKNLLRLARGYILVIEETLGRAPEPRIPIDTVREVYPNDPLGVWKNVTLAKEMPAYFVVSKIEYSDSETLTRYNQVLFLRWEGVKSGRSITRTWDVSAAQEKLIREYLNKQGIAIDAITGF